MKVQDLAQKFKYLAPKIKARITEKSFPFSLVVPHFVQNKSKAIQFFKPQKQILNLR